MKMLFDHRVKLSIVKHRDKRKIWVQDFSSLSCQYPHWLGNIFSNTQSPKTQAYLCHSYAFKILPNQRYIQELQYIIFYLQVLQ